jgi:hypothetical protein
VRPGGIWIALALTAFAAPAGADVDFKLSGVIQSDIRYRLNGDPQDLNYPSQQQLLRYGFSRNDNLIKVRMSLGVGTRVKAVADVDLVTYGFSDLHDLDSATLHERVDPYRLEAHAAYIDLYQVLPGLDLRIGRQTVVWGVADQFNPTSNLNTLDFSDPLLFGRALANNMVRADYNPKGDWVFTAVWVPIFRPAELPRTAPLALLGTDRPPPIQEDGIRNQVYGLEQSYMVKQINLNTIQPEPSLSNSQYAIRAAGRLGGQDVSLSYYHGRFGIPQLAYSTLHYATMNAQAFADVGVIWPKEDVIGGDIAGSIEKLFGLGYWIEGAVVFPGNIDYQVYSDAHTMTGNLTEIRFTPDGKMLQYTDLLPPCPQKAGVPCGNGWAHSPTGVRGNTVTTTPFFKLTIGADTTIKSKLYVNVQYLHGFIDEFGAGKNFHALNDPSMAQFMTEPYRMEQRIGDYLVAGAELHLASDRLNFRFFGVFKLPSLNLNPGPGEGTFDEFRGCSDMLYNSGAPGVACYKFTAVLFPQLIWSVWEGTEISIGSFIFLGDRTTKFGDPAAGASELFAKAKFSF